MENVMQCDAFNLANAPQNEQTFQDFAQGNWM